MQSGITQNTISLQTINVILDYYVVTDVEVILLIKQIAALNF